MVVLTRQYLNHSIPAQQHSNNMLAYKHSSNKQQFNTTRGGSYSKAVCWGVCACCAERAQVQGDGCVVAFLRVLALDVVLQPAESWGLTRYRVCAHSMQRLGLGNHILCTRACSGNVPYNTCQHPSSCKHLEASSHAGGAPAAERGEK